MGSANCGPAVLQVPQVFVVIFVFAFFCVVNLGLNGFAETESHTCKMTVVITCSCTWAGMRGGTSFLFPFNKSEICQSFNISVCNPLFVSFFFR